MNAQKHSTDQKNKQKKTMLRCTRLSGFDILQTELNPKWHHSRFPNSLSGLPEAGIMSTGRLKGPHPTTVQAATWKVALKKRAPPETWAKFSLNSNGSWKLRRRSLVIKQCFKFMKIKHISVKVFWNNTITGESQVCHYMPHIIDTGRQICFIIIYVLPLSHYFTKNNENCS